MNKLISIVGNIAAGKSTLCSKLEKLIPNLKVFIENIEGYGVLVHNYYKDKKLWTPHMQSRMLERKLLNTLDAQVYEGISIIERCLEDNNKIFAFAQYCNGYTNDKSWEQYIKFYNAINTLVKEPDLFLYLKANPVFCYERKKARLRSGEEEITLEYLQEIHNRYEKWIKTKDRYFEVNITKNLSDKDIIYIYSCIDVWFDTPNLVCPKCSSEKIKLKLNFSEAESCNLVPTVECNECGNLTVDNDNFLN